MKANVAMNYIINNWYIFVGMFSLVFVGFWIAYRFLGMPTEKQKEKVREWLVWACIEAERDLQSGTGQLKLRKVYNAFCSVPAFTWVARVIPFALFSKCVSDALLEVKRMLVSNRTLAEYVYGENTDKEVEKIKKQLEG